MQKIKTKPKRSVTKKIILISLLMMISLLYGVAWSWPGARMTAQGEVSALPVTFPIQSAEIAAYFNQIAGPDDIAAFPEPFVRLLPHVTAGKKMVFYRSWAQAEDELDGLLDQIDMVGYNPEHWEHTPLEEQEHLRDTVERGAKFAHERGLQFVLIPDRRFADEQLGQLALYADAIVLQGQRLQLDPERFATWTKAMITIIRASNPEAKIYVQVGVTQTTPSEMLTAIQTVSDNIDGIAVWSMPRSLHNLQNFVSPLRRGEIAPSLAEESPIQEPVVEVAPAAALSTREIEPAVVKPWSQLEIVLYSTLLLGAGLVIGTLFGFGLGRKKWQIDTPKTERKNDARHSHHKTKPK